MDLAAHIAAVSHWLDHHAVPDQIKESFQQIVSAAQPAAETAEAETDTAGKRKKK